MGSYQDEYDNLEMVPIRLSFWLGSLLHCVPSRCAVFCHYEIQSNFHEQWLRAVRWRIWQVICQDLLTQGAPTRGVSWGQPEVTHYRTVISKLLNRDISEGHVVINTMYCNGLRHRRGG